MWVLNREYTPETGVRIVKKRLKQALSDLKREVTSQILGMIALTIMIAVILLAEVIWKEYRDVLMKNQQDQLMATSETLAANMEYTLSNYMDRLDYIAVIESEMPYENVQRLMDEFVIRETNYVTGLVLKTADGRVKLSAGEVPEMPEQEISRVNETTFIYGYNDNEAGIHRLGFRKLIEDGDIMELFIDGKEYYTSLINSKGIGTNGYIMIKDSEGTVVMHVTDEQWGIDVIEGRRILYPDADLTSVDAMIKQQEEGGTGISIYDSYWWGHDPLKKVRKISAYAPVSLGEDFWIVSAVVDYDDYNQPIRVGFRAITALFAGAILVVILMFAVVWRMMHERQRQNAEINNLKLLNESLERVQKGEEMIAHRQRLQVMGTMTGGIAHEINNYLTPIMGYSELLMITLPEDSEEQEYAREVYEASDKCKDVIRQISSLSRKNVETVLKTSSAFKLVDRGVRMMETMCPPNVRCEKIIELSDENVLVNSTQINQVMLNLTVNAVHAIGKKDGLIQVYACTEEREALLEIPALQKQTIPEDWKHYLRIDVTDNGCGMDELTLEHIFTPFFTTKKAGEGTGLGLFLAEQYISSHRGYIYADSKLGEGTTFHIFLPDLEKHEDVSAEERKLHYSGAGLQEKLSALNAKNVEKGDTSKLLTIVAADDNQKVLNLLEKSFEKLNVNIVTCDTREGLQVMLDKLHPDVLLIDDTIPNGRGIDFCMSVKKRYPDLIKILMTDMIDRDVVEARQKMIIDEYLQKPVSDAFIIEAIERANKNREKGGQFNP